MGGSAGTIGIRRRPRPVHACQARETREGGDCNTVGIRGLISGVVTAHASESTDTELSVQTGQALGVMRVLMVWWRGVMRMSDGIGIHERVS